MATNQRRIWTAAGASVVPGAAREPTRLQLWKTTWANVDDQLSLFAQASGQMAYTENHAYARSRLEQELAANYIAEAGPKKPARSFRSRSWCSCPTLRTPSRWTCAWSERGEQGFAISFGRWQIAVNLGEAQLDARVFGRNSKLAPFSALTAASRH